MCGRFTLYSSADEIAAALDVAVADLRPRYNVAPSQEVGAVLQAATGTGRQWAWLRWGLVYSWSKDPGIGNSLINARAETVRDKLAFRSALRRRRCLIAASGFYERIST
jgi:putative SOS response-associated peptidase YedK